MPIFISYSHRDSEFVDRLAFQLVQNKVSIWIDRWEINVGDSLLTKVQEAITGASTLLVVLSRASVGSAWVQREINSGLLRELEERRVIVLPVLIEDCQIPIFLREKAYADFRTDFDFGLRKILDAVARITNANTGRIDEPSYHSDWGFDWGILGRGAAMFRITLVEQANDQPYTVLAVIEITANAAATNSYMEMDRAGRGEEARRRIVTSVVDTVNADDDLVLLLEGETEVSREFGVVDDRSVYHVRISARRLGADTGRDVLYRVGQQLREILRHMNDVAKGPPN